MDIKVLIFNHRTEQWENYNLEPFEQMPYASGFLTVGEFRGQSRSACIWSDRRMLEKFQYVCRYYDEPIRVNYAFRRIEEGGHRGLSAHYAGTAFDMGKYLPAALRRELKRFLIREGLFSYVEPDCMAPVWIHAQNDYTYPNLYPGDRGVYVCVLQDALRIAGIYCGALTGCFCGMTKNAVCRFQHANDLFADGIVNHLTWHCLLYAAYAKVRRQNACQINTKKVSWYL